MNELNSISLIIVFRIIFELVFFVFLFWVSREYLVRLVQNQLIKKRLIFYIPIARNVFWFFYSIYIFSLLIEVNLIFALVTLIFLLLVFWTSIKNLIYGVLYKIQKGDVYGFNITIDDQSGVIVALKNTKIEIENDQGRLFQYPYISLFTQKVSIPDNGKTQLLSFRFDAIDNLLDLDLTDLKRKLMCCPYVVQSGRLRIEIINENQKDVLFISLMVYNTKYSSVVRAYVDRLVNPTK